MDINKKTSILVAKFSGLKWTNYIAASLSGILFALSPVILSYFFDHTNLNNSAYDQTILTKHFIKISASLVLLIGLINLPILLLNLWSKRIYLFLLAVLIYLPAILDAMHVLLFRAGINSSSYYTLFSTHQSEALEFITDYSTVKLVLGTAIIILIPVALYFIYTRFFSLQLKRIITGIYLSCYIIAIFFITKNLSFFYPNELSSVKAFVAYREFTNENKTFITRGNDIPNLNVTKVNTNEKETHIIVIGESTSKYHMGLYGYHRPTTPEIEKIKNQLLVFENVKASHAHTIASLTDVLMLKDSNNLLSSSSIIDLFNQAGFDTYWLSNQQFLGENQTLISAIAGRANNKIFINAQGENKYDEELLPQLATIMAENKRKKIIFVHLMGTHLNYQNRYPHPFNFFKEKNISIFGDHSDSFINHYDNAVKYNDFVVAEIIKQAQLAKEISSVVYFSDHGDEVYDFRDFHGHAEVLLSKYMTDVPFIIYCNQNFINAKKEQLFTQSNTLTKDLKLKNLVHTLHDLYGIESTYFDSSKSFFSAEKNTVLQKEKNKDNSITSHRFFLFPTTKIWAHRVNSIERLQLLQNKFKGIELDIIYTNGILEVRHPPAESIDLSLQLFFESIPEMKDHYFWLDLKNLESENLKEIITQLNSLSDRYSIKNNMIIETPQVKLIPELQKEGYYCSYYIPDLSNNNALEIENNIKMIAANISAYNPAAISQSIDNYQLMNEHFKDVSKLIWALTIDWRDAKNHQRINNLLNKDTTVKVCLVNYHTKGWR